MGPHPRGHPWRTSSREGSYLVQGGASAGKLSRKNSYCSHGSRWSYSSHVGVIGHAHNCERGVASCSSSAHSSNYHLYRSASRSSSYKGRPSGPYRVYGGATTNHSHHHPHHHPLPNNHNYHLNNNHTNHASHGGQRPDHAAAISDDCINSSSFPPDYLVSTS